MKTIVLLLTLALSTIVLAGIFPSHYHAPNPNDIFRQVQFKPLRTLDYAEPEIIVDLSQITFGYHAVAFGKVKVLHPRYALYPVWGCRYSALGLVRFYTFSFKVEGTIQEVQTAVETEDESAKANDDDESKEGFMKVSVTWAQESPRISVGLKAILKENWKLIGGNPLIACWTKPKAGLYTYRFYFKNVNGRFEYKESSKTEDPKEIKNGSSYFAETAPILALTKSNEPEKYVEYLVSELKDHPAFPQIKKLFEEELGFMDDNWIVKYAGVGGKKGNVMKLKLHFKPFLLEQHYEAYYYGDVEKASLLKVDEKVFNQGNSFEKWQEIEDFSKFKAFDEAHEYVLSQFSWLRFYNVVSAYAALHKKGRFIRLVFQGKGRDEVNVDSGNQINIIAYLDERGCYFIDRNDFHATHLNSYGRNEWVSLFVDTPDMTKAKYYQRIVKFHKAIYPKFWFANQMVDIKFKDDLHVIKFKNPINEKYNVLLMDGKETKVLNKVDWIKLDENSPLIGRLENYVRGKYADCGSIMFIQYKKDEKGTHFEVSFMTVKKVYRAVYVLYIEDTDVFTDNKWYSFKAMSFDKHPLPKDVKSSIVAFLKANDQTMLAVTTFVSLSPSSFAIIGVAESGRWQITVEWQDGKWVIVSKQPYKDGYYKAKGYPSALAAAGTGFLKKLYPQQFGNGFVYASIETKNVGVSIFIRFVYKFKGLWIEAVVKKVYGVKASHVLHSWKIVNGLKEKKEFGYGTIYDYSYNVPKNLLYREAPMTVPKPVPVAVAVAPAPPKVKKMTGCPEGTRKEYFTGSCVVVF